NFNKIKISEPLINPDDTLNVKMYGVSADGNTDDTNSIQRVLSKYGNSGKVIFFPKGDYIISNKLNLDFNNMHLLGENGTVFLFSTKGCIPDGRGFVYCDLGLHIS